MNSNRLLISVSFSVFIMITLAAVSCKKKRDVREWSQYDPAPYNCYNGILDSNEVGTDCGGVCEDCYDIPFPCALPENEIDLEFFSPSTVVDSSYLISLGHHVLEFTIDLGWIVRLDFVGFPNVSTFYTIVNYPTDLDEVSVVLDYGSSTDYGYGDLRVRYNNGQHIFQVCSGGFNMSSSYTDAVYNFNYTF